MSCQLGDGGARRGALTKGHHGLDSVREQLVDEIAVELRRAEQDELLELSGSEETLTWMPRGLTGSPTPPRGMILLHDKLKRWAVAPSCLIKAMSSCQRRYESVATAPEERSMILGLPSSFGRAHISSHTLGPRPSMSVEPSI